VAVGEETGAEWEEEEDADGIGVGVLVLVDGPGVALPYACVS